MCRVDKCERRAATSVVREDLPGRIQLCATHTEDFRLNGSSWTITWSPSEALPISVQAAPATPVGRGSSVTTSAKASTAPGWWGKLKTQLPGRR